MLGELGWVVWDCYHGGRGQRVALQPVSVSGGGGVSVHFSFCLFTQPHEFYSVQPLSCPRALPFLLASWPRSQEALVPWWVSLGDLLLLGSLESSDTMDTSHSLGYKLHRVKSWGLGM